MNMIKVLEKEQEKTKVSDFKVGDTVKVHHKVVEGGKERIQVIEGVVIERSKSGSKETFTIRRLSHGVGVERSFLVHSPRIEKIDLVKRGLVRKARLYYLRDKIGKEAKVKEKKGTKAAVSE